MRRKPEVFLLDVWNAADYILRRTRNFELDDYLANEDVRFAVERNFIIIGEAVANLKRFYPEVGTEIEDLAAIVTFRNFIVHQYWLIDDEALWDIIVKHLPELHGNVAALLAKLDTAP